MTEISRPSRINIALILLLAAFYVWSAFWYNSTAYNPAKAAYAQAFLFIPPLIPVTYLAFSEKAKNAFLTGFFFLLIPLSAATYVFREGSGFIFLLVQLPILWFFGISAIVKLRKFA